jgi:hypothetical protein
MSLSIVGLHAPSQSVRDFESIYLTSHQYSVNKTMAEDFLFYSLDHLCSLLVH